MPPLRSDTDNQDFELTIDTTLSMPIKVASRITGFSRDLLYDLIRTNEIKSFTMGVRRFVITESIRDYLRRRAAEPLTIRRGPNTRIGPRVGHHNRLSRKSSTDTTP
jgi:hypothetical protein